MPFDDQHHHGSNLKTRESCVKATIRLRQHDRLWRVWGNDTPNLFDSPGDDKVVPRSHKAEMGPRQAETPVFTGRGFAPSTPWRHRGRELRLCQNATRTVDLLVAGYLEGETATSPARGRIGDGQDVRRPLPRCRQAVNDYGDSPQTADASMPPSTSSCSRGGWDEI